MTQANHPQMNSIDEIDFAAFALEPEQVAALVGARGECVFNWTTSDGYPTGVVVAYVYRDGSFWTNCASHKKRVIALGVRAKSAIVVNADGRSATFRGDSRLHRAGEPSWDTLTKWFYPALTATDADAEPSAAELIRYLNSPNQVIIETPVQPVVSFDYPRFGSAVEAAVRAGAETS